MEDEVLVPPSEQTELARSRPGAASDVSWLWPRDAFSTSRVAGFPCPRLARASLCFGVQVWPR